MTATLLARSLRSVRSRVTDVSRRVGASLDGVVGQARERRELIIFDNAFPHALTGFRLTEFHAYLDAFPTAQVYTTGDAIPAMEPAGNLHNTLRAYGRAFPSYRGRVFAYNPYRRFHASLLYAMFIYNARAIVEKAERDHVPFLFGLNPGGGFRMNDPGCDREIRRVTSSPQFRGAIATQRITRQYLIDGEFCSPEQVHYIFGVPCRPLSDATQPFSREYWGHGKDTLDISFVAFKYMPRGCDKGYDTFIDVAHHLHKMEKRAHFHVVGPWDASDVDVSALGDRIHFYGAQGGEFLAAFHRKMDLNLSPNRPFVLGPGAFDGFPLTCSVEAALCGSAVCAADELAQNDGFVHGEHMLITEPNAAAIVATLEPYLRDPGKLMRLAQAGRDKFLKVYDWEHQMKPRIGVLKQVLSAGCLNHDARSDE